MFKKNTLIGLSFLVVAFILWGLELRQQMRQHEAAQVEEAEHAQQEASEPGGIRQVPLSTATLSNAQSKTISGDPNAGFIQAVQSAAPVQAIETQAASAQYFTLQNEALEVVFTSEGGAIASVAFKSFLDSLDSDEPYRFLHEEGIPALAIGFKDAQGQIQPLVGSFAFTQIDAHRVEFSSEVAPGVLLKRRYALSQNAENPYVLTHSIEFENTTDQAIEIPSMFISAGVAPYEKVDAAGYYLNFGYYSGEKVHFFDLGEFFGSNGFLGINKKKSIPFLSQDLNQVEWISVKNQFFASVLTPEKPGVSIFSRPISSDSGSRGLLGAIGLAAQRIPAGSQTSLNMTYYTGPKKYALLEQLGHGEEGVMQFGPLAFISKILLMTMVGIHSMIPNWGVTIILLTCLIKLMLFPLTAKATASSRKMAALQEPMKALKQKYKDSPQKLQKEMGALFKEHQVNPAAGCLPVFVQIPIFLALFWMLRSASELRFASFLWVKDLSAPDTIAHLGSIPINILPILMGVSLFAQMKLTPTPATDPMQQKLFQFFPLLFLFISYNFASGLVLYWTVQNIFTIVQQAVTRKPMTQVLSQSVPGTRAKRGKAKS